MHHDGTVAQERADACLRGEVEIRVGLAETALLGDVSVLAAQVTDLAGSRGGRVARRHLAADERVCDLRSVRYAHRATKTERTKMREGSSAVAVSWHGLVVNVVD